MPQLAQLPGVCFEGNLLVPDMATELTSGELRGQAAIDFGFTAREKLSDMIALAWGDAKDLWSMYRRRFERLDEQDLGTSVTRERWIVPLLGLLGYELTYTPKAEVVNGMTFAISHRAGSLGAGSLGAGDDRPPVHAIGARVGLEQRPPSGTPRLSAHALMQEYLNCTEHLWGVVTNGLRWRLLRDSSLMTRLTYIEFDLEQILENDSFAEFELFYRLFHRSRLPRTMDDCDQCLLEFYHQEAQQQGGRVRDKLREGVEEAIAALANGFLQHRENQGLRDRLRAAIASDGTIAEPLAEADLFRVLLKLIYRLLFLMVAESRGKLLGDGEANAARIYREYYSIERLRGLAEQQIPAGEAGFGDLWQGLRVTFRLFDEYGRGGVLGLSPLNGDLFGSQALAILDECQLDNVVLLQAVRSLSLYADRGRLRRVNYEALDVEELGSVYESLLDLSPQVIRDGVGLRFEFAAGTDRKTSGSYYTPSALVKQLVMSALEPVIENALKQAVVGLQPQSSEGAKALQHGEGAKALQRERLRSAILEIKVCDPACGSGHFLLAAVRRLGLELARIETGEREPGKVAIDRAKREVLRHCIYGVDLNPLAVDLCKVALWLEGLCAGLPLNFLDHRIKCGNSLVGVLDLGCLDLDCGGGIPDGAFKAIAGDEKSIASSLKKRNKQELKDSKRGQIELDLLDRKGAARSVYVSEWREFGALSEGTTADIRAKVSRYREQHSDRNAVWWSDFVACNLWTAAFFWRLTGEGLAFVPTSRLLERVVLALSVDEVSAGDAGLLGAIAGANELAERLRFFHWPLEFPEVFSEDRAGFDCILGNPPWEQLQLAEKEFFLGKDAAIVTAKTSAARKKLIAKLPEMKPGLAREWEDAKHFADAQTKFIRESGRFPLTARGKINTYAVFSELDRRLISGRGFAGVIVPTGIATDATTAPFFADLVKTSTLKSITGFKNERFIFQHIEHVVTFCIVTMRGKESNFDDMEFVWLAYSIEEALDPKRKFSVSPSEFKLINPNTLTCPVFRTRQDAELTKKIYQRVPVLENEATGENLWGISFMQGLFNMSSDSGLFFDEPGSNRLSLYEAKMFHQFDHRFSTYAGATQKQLNVGILPRSTDEQKQDPDYAVTPRYWVDQLEVENKLRGRWKKNWFLGWRDICRSTDERTLIANVFPKSGFGDTVLLMFPKASKIEIYSCLLANFNSLVVDFVTRQKVGGTHLKFFTMRQIPILPPDRYTQTDINYITPRVLELTYTAHDLRPFAQDLWNPTQPQPPQPIITPDPQSSLNLQLDTPQQLTLSQPNPQQQQQLRQHILQQWRDNQAENLSQHRPTIDPDQLTPHTDTLPIAPFSWNEPRRAIIRAQLDAYYAKLYGLTRDELRYILDPADIHGDDFPSETFRVLKNNELKKYGEYRTQRLVLAAFDRL